MNQLLVRRRTRRLAAMAGTALLAGALALTGCASRVPADRGAGAGPRNGGTVTILQSADIAPTTLLSQNNPNFAFIRTVFNMLTTMDHRTLQPRPELATSWQIAPDQKSITLHLRRGVVFHSGREFTADDVMFTLEAIQRKDVSSQLKHVAAAITAMKAADPYTLTLTLQHPVSNLFDLFEVMPIVDKNTFDDLLAGKKFVGTGPFVVKSYTPGSGVELEKNEHYWKPGLPHLDGVNIEVQSQSQSMLSSLRSGQSQIGLDLAPLDTAVLRGDPGFRVIATDASDATYFVGSNVTIPPFNDVRVRQGIAWAIDRKRILAQALAGIGSTSSLPWSPSSPAFDPVKANMYHQDIGKARGLIAAAGATGKPIEIAFNAGFLTNQTIAEIVQFDLRNAGLNPKLVPLQAADFFARLGNGDMPGLYVNVHGFGQLSPATLVNGAFPFSAKKNASNFDSPQYRIIANQLWTASDPADARTAYDRANDFLLQNQFVSDLVVSAHTFTISSKLENLGYTMYDYIDLDDAYLTN